MKSIDNLAEEYIASRLAKREIAATSARTMRTALRSVTGYIGHDAPPNQISARALDGWLAGVNLQTEARRYYSTAAKNFCRWLHKQGHLPIDPAADLKIPSPPRLVPRDLPVLELGAIRDLAWSVPRERLLVALMAEEGLRCKETAGVQLADINRPRKTLLVVHGKGGHERLLPLTRETGRAIDAYVEHMAGKFGVRLASGPLIRSELAPTRGLTAGHISVLVSRLMRRAGVTGTAHQLRHTMAARMVEHGAHVRFVQQALGHAAITSTQRYMPFADVAELSRWMDPEPEEAA